jgi:hypothetical protein
MPYSCCGWAKRGVLFLTLYLKTGESVKDYAVLSDKQSHKVLLSVQVLGLTRFAKWICVWKCEEKVPEVMIWWRNQQLKHFKSSLFEVIST